MYFYSVQTVLPQSPEVGSQTHTVFTLSLGNLWYVCRLPSPARVWIWRPKAAWRPWPPVRTTPLQIFGDDALVSCRSGMDEPPAHRVVQSIHNWRLRLQTLLCERHQEAAAQG